MYTHLELHLAAVPLSRKHARAIVKCGGKANALRSHYSHQRFVTLPATERALIDELVRAYPCRVNSTGGKKGTCIVARGGEVHNEPAWVVVQYVASVGELGACEQFDVLYASAREQAVKRGILKSDEQVAWDQMHAEATAENGRRNRAIHLEVMTAALELYILQAMGRTDYAERRAMAEKYLKQYREGRVL